MICIHAIINGSLPGIFLMVQLLFGGPNLFCVRPAHTGYNGTGTRGSARENVFEQPAVIVPTSKEAAGFQSGTTKDER
jgi:hypothetical protein